VLDTAGLIGTYGLSAMVVLTGGALWLLLRREWKGAFYTLVGLTLAAGLYDAPQLRPPTGRLIQVVQPNIGQQNKWTDGYAEVAARKLASLSPRLERPRLVLWPEAAVTNPLSDNRPGPGEAFARFERRRAAAALGPQDMLMTGGLAFFSSDGRTVDGATNSVFTVTPQGEIVHRFDKSHLTPYGEYLPMRSVLEPLGLSRLAPGEVDFTPGPGPATVDVPGWGKVGIQICYEIIFSGQVVDSRNRPDFIFNPSNDAWFGRWGPPQHFAQARLRAAEEGLPVVRSTPTGISGIIDAHGRTLSALPWQQAGVVNAELPPPAAALTPFARFGNWLPMILAFGLLFTAIVLDARRR
jgi:apolipoprotein N-acyltransferase